MKKLVAMILIATLCCATAVVDSVSTEKLLYLQTFEKVTDANEATGVSDTYATGKYYRAGGAAGRCSIANVSYEGVKSIAYFSTSSGGQVRGTVGIDQTKLVLGSNYKLRAKIRVNRASSKKTEPLSINVGMLKGYGTDSFTFLTTDVNDTGTSWITVESPEFTDFVSAYDKYFYIQFNATYLSATNLDTIYVDNVELVNTNGGMFTRSETTTFENYMKGFKPVKNVDYSASVSEVTVVNNVSGSGKCLQLPIGDRYGRFEMRGLFSESDLDKYFDISFDVYIDALSSNPSSSGIRFGLKADGGGTDGSNSNWGAYFVWKTVGNSTADIPVKKWTTINLKSYKVSKVNNRITDRLAISQNDNTELYTAENIYIDNISVTPADESCTYFEKILDNGVDSFESDRVLVKNDDWAPGGGYVGNVSISRDTAKSGTRSLKVAGRNSENCYPYARAKFLNVFKDAKIGDVYKVSAYFKGAGENSSDTSISFGVVTNEIIIGQQYYPSIKVDINNRSWTKAEFTYIVQTDSNGVKLDALFVDQNCLLGTMQNQNCDIIYIDDLIVEKQTSINYPLCLQYDGLYYGNAVDTYIFVDSSRIVDMANTYIIISVRDADNNVITSKALKGVVDQNYYTTGVMGDSDKCDVSKMSMHYWKFDNRIPYAVLPAEVFQVK